MAKPFLKSNSTNYYIRIKQWDSVEQKWKWKNQSTGTNDLELAQSLQESLQNVANAAHKLEGKTVDQRHIQSVITSIYASAGVVIEESTTWPTIRDSIDKYMRGRKPRVKFSTYNAYRVYINHFYAFAPEDARLDWFTPERANEWYDKMIESSTPKTTNERFKFISRFYDRCIKEIGYPSNPCKSVDIIGVSAGQTLDRLPFSLDELTKIVKHLRKGTKREKEWCRTVMISAMTGARLEDAVSMTSDAIVDDVLTYTQTKTGKTLTIPLVVPEWAKELSKHKGRICPTLYYDYVTKRRRGVPKEFTQIVCDAGVDQSYTKFKSGQEVARKTFHSLRHTLRTLIVASGGSDAQADLILGHSGSQGKTYTHSEVDSMKLMLGKVFTK